jgi:flavorubredoxin
MTTTTEIAPDVFRVTTYVPEIDLQFSQFLVRDDEPLLYHTGMRALFPAVREAVARLVDPSALRWIAFSHFEADECGALNEWLALAPRAEARCSFVGAMVSVNDFASRPAQPLLDGETFSTGRKRFRLLATPHVPHCWEASHLFEETDRTLFSSDLLHQAGDVEPLSESEDLLERHRRVHLAYQEGPFANYFPFSPLTEPALVRLAALDPRTIATMHGSAFRGDGGKILRGLARVLRETLA